MQSMYVCMYVCMYKAYTYVYHVSLTLRRPSQRPDSELLGSLCAFPREFCSSRIIIPINGRVMSQCVGRSRAIYVSWDDSLAEKICRLEHLWLGVLHTSYRYEMLPHGDTYMCCGTDSSTRSTVQTRVGISDLRSIASLIENAGQKCIDAQQMVTDVCSRLRYTWGLLTACRQLAGPAASSREVIDWSCNLTC